MRDVDLRKNLFAMSCSQVARHRHVYVKEEEWEVIFQPVCDGREQKRTRDPFCTDTSFFWRSKCVRGRCEADADCTRASVVHRRLSFFCCFHQFHQEIGGCTANDGGFEPCF